MLHHIDVHVPDLAAAVKVFDAIAPAVGYRRRFEEPGSIGYETSEGGRPRIVFDRDPHAGTSPVRLAFAVDSRERVDEAARLAAGSGAAALEGPALHPEYGNDYYAVFFEAPGGVKFEIVVDAQLAVRPRIARIWRSRVKPGKLAAYRRYIEPTGINDYRTTPGNCGAWLLSARLDEVDEVMALSFWASRDAIVRFAGEPIERAQYYSEDDKYLLDFPEHVEHFDID